MHNSKGKFISAILIFILVSTGLGYSESPDEPMEWDTNRPSIPELPPEAVEELIERIAHSDPERVEELKKLHKEEPEKFAEIVHRELKKDFDEERSRDHKRGRKPGRGYDKHDDIKDRLEQMKQKHDDYLEWLKENYPEHHQKLQQEREENPMLYLKKLKVSVDKYGYIYRKADDNPELAELLKKDLELKEQRDSLLKEMSSAEEKSEKENLKEQLREVVSQRYDLIVQRKKLEYEKLLEKLEKLKEKVNESKTQVKKWQEEDFKNENVNARLEKLLTENKSFEWD